MSEETYMKWETFKGNFQRTSAHARPDNGVGVADGDLDPVWTADPSEFDAAPAVAGDKLIAGENPVAAYRLEDGEQVWTAPVDGQRDDSPVVADGTVVFTTRENSVVALDLATGLEEWSVDLTRVSGSPTVADGTVLVPNSKELVALDLGTGEEEWRASGTNRDISHAPVVAEGTVFVAGEMGNRLALDLETGAQEWLDDDLGNSPVEGGQAPAAMASLVFLPNDDHLTCLNVESGEERWEFSGYDMSTPAIADRTVFVAGDSTLYALDGTGSEKWSVEFEYSIRNAPAVIDDTVVVGYQDTLYGYDTDTGEQVFEYPANEEIASVPVGAYGAAVVGLRHEGLQVLLPRGESVAVPEATRSGGGDESEVSFVAAEGWSTRRCGPRRTGALPDASGPDETPGERWRYAGTGQLYAVLDGDTAYVASEADNELAAVDLETGIAAWEFDVGERVAGPPVVTGDLAFVADDYGTLFAVDAGTGEQRYTFEPEGAFPSVDGGVTVADGTMYVPDSEGTLSAVDVETADREWAFEKREGFGNAVVVTEEMVITPNTDGSVYGVDRERGEERWATELPGMTSNELHTGIGAGHGLVFVGARAEGGGYSLVALDPSTGIQEWQHELPNHLVGTPVVGEEHVYAATNDRGRSLVAVDPGDGEEVWSASFSREPDAAPALADGVVYVDTGQGAHAVEAESGRELFAVDSSGYGMAPAVGDGVALFAEDGAVGAYDLASAGTADADADAGVESEADAAGAGGGGGGAGGPGGPPDTTFRSVAAEETADDPDDPGDEAIRAVALGVLVDAWHEEFARDADLAFEVMMDFVSEELPGVTEQTLEFNLDALDGEGAVDFEPAFKTTTLRARGLDRYYQYTGEKPVPDRDLLGVLQPLYNAMREGESVARERLIEETGLDPDYLDRIVWMLHDQGVFAGELYLSGPGTGAVDVYAEGVGDGWWIDAQLTDHGRQLFEELR